MPIMTQQSQQDIVTGTTALFAKYGIDITSLGDMYSQFWGEYFSYIQTLTKQEGTDLLTKLKVSNPVAYTVIKNSKLFTTIYDDVFTKLG